VQGGGRLVIAIDGKTVRGAKNIVHGLLEQGRGLREIARHLR
jgi:hypothetical protein